MNKARFFILFHFLFLLILSPLTRAADSTGNPTGEDQPGKDQENAGTVDTARTSLGETLDFEFIQRLPSSRRYQDVLLLVPGVLADPNSGAEGNWNVHGASVRDNAYYMDGMNITDPATGTLHFLIIRPIRRACKAWRMGQPGRLRP